MVAGLRLGLGLREAESTRLWLGVLEGELEAGSETETKTERREDKSDNARQTIGRLGRANLKLKREAYWGHSCHDAIK